MQTSPTACLRLAAHRSRANGSDSFLGEKQASCRPRLVARAYVDGFNLYYGALKHTRFKWIDVRLLCETLLPEYRFEHILYATARVKASPFDSQGASERQDVYLRALSTIDNLTIAEGTFSKKMTRMRVNNTAYREETEEVPSSVMLNTLESHEGEISSSRNRVVLRKSIGGSRNGETVDREMARRWKRATLSFPSSKSKKRVQT